MQHIAVNFGGIHRLELSFLYLGFSVFFAEEIRADFQKSSGNTAGNWHLSIKFKFKFVNRANP